MRLFGDVGHVCFLKCFKNHLISKQFAGVVRSVMTYGVFVELELQGGSTLWGFVAPEKLKGQHQSWRGEEGNLKAYVKKDALKLGQELKVRVLPTSAMSHLVCIS